MFDGLFSLHQFLISGSEPICCFGLPKIEPRVRRAQQCAAKFVISDEEFWFGSATAHQNVRDRTTQTKPGIKGFFG